MYSHFFINQRQNQLRGHFLSLEESVTKTINKNKCRHLPKETEVKNIVFKLKLALLECEHKCTHTPQRKYFIFPNMQFFTAMKQLSPENLNFGVESFCHSYWLFKLKFRCIKRTYLKSQDRIRSASDGIESLKVTV